LSAPFFPEGFRQLKLKWATLPFLNSLKIVGFVSREIFFL